MFDLDCEVKKWCRSQWGFFGISTRRSLELEDHLHCEVESLRLQGLDALEAFRRAKQKMGNPRHLRREYARVTREALLCRRNVACTLAIAMFLGIFGGALDWVLHCGSQVLAFVMMVTWNLR